MKKVFINFSILLTLAFLVFNCSVDEDSYQDVNLRIISDITGEGIEGVKVLIGVYGVRGQGLFSSTYEVSKTTAITDSNGYLSAVLNYESTRNYFRINVLHQDICTNILHPSNNFFFEEIRDTPLLELKVRRYSPMEVIVKSINPYDENDRISVTFYHVGFGLGGHSPLYDIQNRGDINDPFSSPGDGGIQPFWIGNNVDSTIYKRVAEGTEAKIRWIVIKNEVVTEFESEFIPTVQNETIYYEINY